LAAAEHPAAITPAAQTKVDPSRCILCPCGIRAQLKPRHNNG
jgi:hypothetical protein